MNNASLDIQNIRDFDQFLDKRIRVYAIYNNELLVIGTFRGLMVIPSPNKNNWFSHRLIFDGDINLDMSNSQLYQRPIRVEYVDTAHTQP